MPMAQPRVKQQPPSGPYISILVHLLGLVFIFSPSLAFIGRAALFCVAWVSADASVIRVYSRGSLPFPFPRPLPLHVRGVEERFISQSLTLLLVGRTGW